MKKLYSFTLAEMIVTMVLTLIVVGIALMVMRMVRSRFEDYRGRQGKSSDLIVLEYMLRRDIQSARRVSEWKEEEQSGMVLFLPGGDSLEYRFTGEKVIRISGKDSADFELKTALWESVESGPHYTYNSRDSVVFANAEKGVESAPEYIRALSLDLVAVGDTVHLNFFKDYAAEFYMNPEKM